MPSLRRHAYLGRGSSSGAYRLTALAGFALTIGALLFADANASPAQPEPYAVTAPADPTVGALFSDGITSPHECTASVLSNGRGLLLTAAHCLRGTGAGMQFVPGYDGTAADPMPFGVWTVTRVWVPPGWLRGQEPADDLAVLQVEERQVGGRLQSIDQVTGGNVVSVLGRTLEPIVGRLRGPVSVTAYNAGAGDAPLSCTTGGVDESTPNSFRCGGYSGGTSGAPWLQQSTLMGQRTVVGIIGGRNQGGCTEWVSYSPELDGAMYGLLLRAAFELTGDDVPAADGDGC